METEDLWDRIIFSFTAFLFSGICYLIHTLLRFSSGMYLYGVEIGEGVVPGILYSIFMLPWYYILGIFILIIEIIYWLIPRSYYLERDSDNSPMFNALGYKLKILWSIFLAFPFIAVIADLFKLILISCNNLILDFAKITKEQWFEIAKGFSSAILIIGAIIIFIWLNSFKMRFKARKTKKMKNYGNKRNKN